MLKEGSPPAVQTQVQACRYAVNVSTQVPKARTMIKSSTAWCGKCRYDLLRRMCYINGPSLAVRCAWLGGHRGNAHCPALDCCGAEAEVSAPVPELFAGSSRPS